MVTLASSVTLSRLINGVINYPCTSIRWIQQSLIGNIENPRYGNILQYHQHV